MPSKIYRGLMMTDDFYFGATMGFLVAMILALFVVDTFTYGAPKRSWSCTKLSQPTVIDEQVRCLQYTKD